MASAVRPANDLERLALADGCATEQSDSAANDEADAAALNTSGTRSSNRNSQKEERRAEAEVDRALIDRAKHGDTAAFRQLVERHQRRAFRLALGLLRDEEEAREVVQEAFLRVHKNLAGFQQESSFYTWLYRIVSNLAIDVIRKPGRDVHDELDEALPDWDEDADVPLLSRIDGSDPLDATYRMQLAARIGDALDQLPPYHRGVIVMREIEGLSYEEMAEAMGVSKGTIMSRLYHARQKMQRALTELYIETQGHAPPARATSDAVAEGEPE